MTAAAIERALRSRRVVTPAGVRAAMVLVAQGRIAALAPYDAAPPPGVPLDDLGELALLPGVVDTHVHIDEPGRTEWEGFASATAAAAAGGVTTVVDMPLNSDPPTTTPAALAAKREAAAGQCRVDCGFFGGVVPGNTAQLVPLAEAGVLGFKAFLCPSGIEEFPPLGEHELREAMVRLADCGLPLLVHAELLDQEAAPAGAAAAPRTHSAWLASRPPRWERRALELLVRLVRSTGCRTHVVHLAAADALVPLRAAHGEGLPVSAESCPHYLFFCAEEVPERDPRFKCAPPIREREHREALWQALAECAIELIASDHSPTTPANKRLAEGDFAGAWGGIASLGLALPVVWTAARERGFELADLARWMAATPAALVGLADRKGAIEPGRDADLVVFDPEAEFSVEPGRLLHRHPETNPYLGRRLRGVVCRSYLRGEPVFDGGRLVGEPRGQLLVRPRRAGPQHPAEPQP
ncbi:MAG: allantoinase [Planctomycetota bacterium]|nr:MAG: allantoinase [Planctomycetota bacterium]